MTGVAALRMYDLDAVRAPYDELWSAIASRLDGAPDELTWTGAAGGEWRDPELVLGQACGWPLVTELRDAVTVVGAFSYSIDGGATAPAYRSVLVAARPSGGRRDDAEALTRGLATFAGAVAAFNGRDSLSGWVSLGVAVADCGGPVPFFDRLVETGSHLASAESVRSGAADIASIDAVSWALFERHAPALTRGLAVVGHGPAVPTLPLITSAGRDPEPLRDALAAAVGDPATAACRAALLIDGFHRLDLAAYEPLADFGPTARAVLEPSEGARRGGIATP